MNIRGHITRIFCHKPNGWFSILFLPDGKYKSIRIIGKYHQELDEDIDYDIECELCKDNGYGEQYEIKYMSPHVELDEESIRTYLSGNSFKGIGPVIADKIVNEFGSNTLDIIANTPNALKEKLNLTQRQIGILFRGVTSGSIENKLRKLVPNITDALITKIIETYSDDGGETGASEIFDIINNRPYQLLYDVERVTFNDIDKIALAVGIQKYDAIRMSECYKFCLYQYTINTGNLFIVAGSYDYNVFYCKMLTEIGFNDVTLNDKTITKGYVDDLFQNASKLVSGIKIDVNKDNQQLIYNKTVYEEESGTAESIAKALVEKSAFMRHVLGQGYTLIDAANFIDEGIISYERKCRIKLDDCQKLAVKTSLMSNVSVINGGPGHGKTSTLNCILHIWSKWIKDMEPVLSAPTGRAVTVLKNATENAYEVATAMRLIVQYDRVLSSDDDKKYKELTKRYTNNLVILDECSMVGIKTAYHFLSMFEGCQFIFVGDVDQLPSIEYGQFFKDICSCSSIMRTELVINHRADGKLIIDNAVMINNGDVDNIDYTDADQFEMIEEFGDFSTSIIDMYKQFVYDKDGNLDKIAMSKTAILCPTTKHSTGSLWINKMIQDLVNPYNMTAEPFERGYEIAATHMYIDENNKDLKLRVGDRVMQTKNRADAECTILVGVKRQDSLGIFNGDTGVIVSYNPSSSPDAQNTLTLLLDDGRQTIIEEEYMKELTLAYAMTVHKSQGSEYDTVIFSSQPILASNNTDFVCRNLLYTAVTRARKHVKLIGVGAGIINCINIKKRPRNSMLHEKIMRSFLEIKSAS